MSAVASTTGTRRRPADRSGDRADYLGSVSRLLWPPPTEVEFARAGRSPHIGSADGEHPVETRRFMIVPSQAEPRLVVPVKRRVAAAAVGRHRGSGSPASRMRSRVAQLALRGGAGPLLFRDRLLVARPEQGPALDSYLGTALGCELYVTLEVTGARANRKPLMQLMRPDGALVAFAKVGTDELTRRLVRSEGEALARLASVGLSYLSVPRVLHRGRWNELEVLALSPLPSHLERRLEPTARLLRAMKEIARIAGVTEDELAPSAYWRRLQDRLSSAPASPERASLESALDLVRRRAGTATLSYGSWHGDWSPWNTAIERRGDLWVWDWERLEVGVPLGFDLLHHRLQAAVHARGSSPPSAAAALVDQGVTLLAPFGVSGREARLTALLYLAELSVRYLEDRQEAAGARLGNPGWWLIPALTAEVER